MATPRRILANGTGWFTNRTMRKPTRGLHFRGRLGYNPFHPSPTPRGAAMSNPAPDIPPIKEYKSAQYEFNDEQNKAISGLTDAMRVVAGLMQLMGLAFVVICALSVTSVIQTGGSYGPAIGLGSAAVLCL